MEEQVSGLNLDAEEKLYLDSKLRRLGIDSVLNSKNFFLHNQNKILKPSENFRNFIYDREYKSSSINKDLLFANKASDALGINKLIESPKPLASKDETSTDIAKYSNSINEISKNLPEHYQLKDKKDENLMVSLYRNQNHISFRKHKEVKPEYHPQWKLYRVISGHTGWVRCIDIDPTNNWFVTGSNDRVIKFWDLASGRLKLSLTGHINTVREVAVSPRHPYLFSCGEDKQIKCWDLEQNKVVRHYHGHLSGVYSLAIHPTQDIIVSGGRDCCVRVWDMRSKNQIYVLEGHNHTIASVVCQEFDPQIISGSHDSTIRTWDLATGKVMSILTHHKKSIRSLAFHPDEYSFLSGGCDNVKVWKCPESKFLRNLPGHQGILNSIAVNKDGVVVAGTDSGILRFWDYKSGSNFQTIETTVQPGSLSSEAGIFCCKFDHSSSRLITAECDKTIKMWKEVTEDYN